MTALPIPAARHAQAPVAQAAPAASPVVTARTVGAGRLFLIETRKLVDTRAARWLLVATFALAALVVGLSAVFMPQYATAGVVPAGQILNTGLGSLTLLLPVMAVLLAAGEWTQRGALVTFTLEPRRVRVLLAKVAAVVAASIALCLAVAALSLAVTAIAGIAGHHTVDWTMDGGHLLWAAVVTILAGLEGLAFGALLMNAPAAIVVYFLYPTLLQMAGMISASALEVTSWLDPNRAFAPLTNSGMGEVHWGKIAVSVGLWMVLPLVAGAIRLVKREVN